MTSRCIVCNSTNLEEKEIVDHFLSKEKFKVSFCSACGHGTTDFPNHKNIASYYESEEYLSHTSTSFSLISILYQASRTIMMKLKARVISKYSKEASTILDYGCGTGNFLDHMRQRGWKIAGLEPSSLARVKAESKNGTIIFSTLEELKENYRVITLWHVIEHTPDPGRVLATLSQHVEPGGILLVAVPNYRSYDAQHYKIYWAGYDVPRHLQHFTNNSLIKLATQSGWSFVESQPMKLDSFYVSLLSETYQRSKPTLLRYIKAFRVGALSNLKAIGTNNYSSNIFIFKKS